MSGLVRLDAVSAPDGARVLRFRLDAPRSNALEPKLLAAIGEALDVAARDEAGAILIAGGRNFSTGGDVAAFRDAVRRGEAEAYAAEVVPKLQALVARLLAMPKIVAVAAQGAATGGAAGMLFAADVAVLSPNAFIQPYYAKVGFAPDGGWTALLPERIGAGAALGWLVSDRRIGAAEAVSLGLASEVADDPESRALSLLSGRETGVRLAAKTLIWDEARRARVAAGLAAEWAAFRDRIGRPETAEGMDRFLRGLKAPVHV